MRSILVLSLLAVAVATTACVDPPDADGFACGAHGECPEGTTCRAGRCVTGDPTDPGPTADAGPDDAGPNDASSGPPVARITQAPPDASSSAAAELHFDAGGGGAPATSFYCRVDGAPFVPCASPYPLAMLAEGRHTFDVYAVDALAEVGPTARAAWTVDVTAPVATVAGAPPPISGTQVTFILSASEDGCTFECALDTGAWQACNTTQDYGPLSAGNHGFRARATDRAGNLGPETKPYAWSVDPTTFATSITSGPGAISGTSVTFTFTATRTGSTFQCSLDPAGAPVFADCATPQGYSSLSGGTHTLHVRAENPPGVYAVEAMQTWTVDATAPTAVISSPAAGQTTGTGVDVTFDAEPDATYECALDAAPLASCRSPLTLVSLSNGAHHVSVRATDRWGNRGPVVSVAWTVDATPPAAAVISAPAAGSTSGPAVNVTFSVEAGATASCRVDSMAWVGCNSPWTISGLATGPHTVTLVPTDAYGNVGMSAAVTWTVDATPPSLAITSPTGADTGSDIPVTFTTDDSGATFTCKLDAAVAAGCSSGLVLHGQGAGAHTLTIVATDAHGNATSGSVSWHVVPPSLSITTPSAAAVTGPSTSVTFSATTGATVTCAVDAQPAAACTSPWIPSALSDGSHTATLVARDSGANTTTAMVTWTVDATPPTVTLSSAQIAGVYSNQKPINFTAGCTEAGCIYICQLDGGFWTGASGSTCTAPITQEGSHRECVIAYDAVGNASAPVCQDWIADFTPPSFAWYNTTVDTYGSPQQQTVSYEMTDANGISYAKCTLRNSVGKRLWNGDCGPTETTVSVPSAGCNFDLELDIADFAGNVSVQHVPLLYESPLCDP